jgi:hypothetical protein
MPKLASERAETPHRALEANSRDPAVNSGLVAGSDSNSQHASSQARVGWHERGPAVRHNLGRATESQRGGVTVAMDRLVVDECV